MLLSRSGGGGVESCVMMKAPRMMKAAVTVLLCVVASCEPSESDRRDVPVYTVEIAHPQWGEVAEYKEWIGTLYGGSSAAIEPQVSGYVAEKCVSTGALVHKGEVLFRIDDTRYRQALTLAQQQQEQARANFDEAHQNAAYYRPLVAGGSISRQTYTDAVQKEQAAAAALAAAKANCDLAQTQVDYCTLRAPIDGVTGFAQADVGSYVSPQGAPLVVINSMNPISIHFSISGQEWLNQGGMSGALRPGARLQLILPNGESYNEPATITGVDNQVSDTTGTLMLDAQVANPDDLLRPGMFVRVRAQVEAAQKALLVPQQAIVEVQGRAFVLVVDEHMSVTPVPVETGLARGNMVAISGEVSPNSFIITQGTQQGLMAVSGHAKIKTQIAKPEKM